ncbi:MAG: hypothetical protein JWQ52_1048 [Phenylobacterium sp.]|jgi:uncharacterized RDD family membrane protein YckC|nr:hypothetical protein [Phenylobacterium sp.]
MTAGFTAWRAARRVRKPRPEDDGRRAFVTPEGVDLQLRVAAYSERCGAFVLDVLILLGVLIVMTILLGVAAWGTHSPIGAQLMQVIWLLGAFALRNFYFIGFELRPGAATPGKRAMGLRVIARDGGRLTADAVFARNAMREIEVFLPAMFLFSRGYGVDAGLVALGAIWSGVFVLFPLFNRDRLRLGDLAAGTMVVKTPKRVLRPDLAQEAPATVAGVAFTQAQLDAYGVKELHVLEQVLRTGDRRTTAEVARRIRTKIGWDGPLETSDRAFLGAYYAALRGRLETRLLFGHRRRDKFDRS